MEHLIQEHPNWAIPITLFSTYLILMFLFFLLLRLCAAKRISLWQTPIEHRISLSHLSEETIINDHRR